VSSQGGNLIDDAGALLQASVARDSARAICQAQRMDAVVAEHRRAISRTSIVSFIKQGR